LLGFPRRSRLSKLETVIFLCVAYSLHSPGDGPASAFCFCAS
jgi:hypothetical protein